MSRTVITLRARFCGAPPRPGELMFAPSSPAVYRVDVVTTLRQAGEPDANRRYRLTCTLLAASEVPKDAVIHPWRWGGLAPRQKPLQPVRAPQAIHVAQIVPKPAQRPHSGLSARHPTHTGGDFGPGLRRRAARDHHGKLLREPDVEVDDRAAGDPDRPNRRIRRAYRVDPVDHLRRDGTLGPRQVQAAGDLRQHLEMIVPSASGDSLTLGGVAPHSCQLITDSHLRAAKVLRSAAAALGDRLWPPVLWVCLGGTARGYADQWHIRQSRAPLLMAEGLAGLADHLYGREG